jgi:acyl-CoA reductase-like NAD-dependent aldehyde dehydrogenase
VKRDDPRHGTYAGAQQHQKEGSTPCRPCKDARNAYMAAFRKGSAAWRDQNNARSRALWRLADVHREEFDRLYVEERTRDHVEQMKRRAS